MAEQSDSIVYKDSNGYLGIGTTTPDHLLHLKSTGDIVLKLEADSDDSNENDNPLIHLTQDGGSVYSKFGLNGLAGEFIANACFIQCDKSLQFAPGDTIKMTILENGNVGIGTTSPDSMMNITSTVDRGMNNTNNKTLLTLHNNPTEDCNAYEWSPISLDFKLSNNDGDFNPITRIASVCCPHTSSAPSTVAGEKSTALTFSTTNGGTFSEAMRISQKGYIGIGTHSPNAPLHVDTYAMDLANGTTVRSYLRHATNASLGGPSSTWIGETAGRFSIRTSYNIWAEAGYVMASDSRIKTNISNVDDDRALQQVNALESKEYHYIDPMRIRQKKP